MSKIGSQLTLATDFVADRAMSMDETRQEA